ncbi:hypothetical protein CkaCkLH20_02869 [Colletotrichum karsti]|uniref:Prolyl 4-hydroxylase alpha subunit Fe(2+) 2OG dioxygenase domain-containing protein n=1 Tax=Colletotrichum karsti TaxID=1095194 RepID=A0A9P6ICJ3_9PEZI|nr:uncharacterized protein CkaCkLH20_02869 [Colletotrichum karsti]KAF9879326.1 hypothetical protein CkaCkLH20_02869 [Colletotrichum karsti]
MAEATSPQAETSNADIQEQNPEHAAAREQAAQVAPNTELQSEPQIAGELSEQPVSDEPLEYPEEAVDAASPLSTEGWNNRQLFEEDLNEALNDIQSPGTFASLHPLKGPLDPQLFVPDVGAVTLPLREADARGLVEKARQAPYGKGSDTVVDTSVRNTWELDPSQFELRSPSWTTVLRQLTTIVARDLGINAPIVAELYKLLVYEKGAMFKAHVDTEKIPGMFGTLVICLPSPHDGGEVVARHCGETKTLKTSKYREGSFAAWYSDVSHEVRPVTWGYRVVLTYNLALDPSKPVPSAGLRRTETRKLRHTLRRWLSGGAGECESDHVFYRLDHEYSEANISKAAMKGRDHELVQVLDDLSTELEFDIFLAGLERREEGSVEYYGEKYNGYRYRNDYSDEEDGWDDEDEGWHELQEVFMEEERAKFIVGTNGRPVLRDVRLEEDRFLDSETFFQDGDQEEDYQGFMGNSGPSATHWYRVTAVLLVPRVKVVSFLRSHLDEGKNHRLYSDGYVSKGEMTNQRLVISYLTSSALRPGPAQASALQALRDIWNETICKPKSKVTLGDDDLVKLLQGAVQLREWGFFKEIAAEPHGLIISEFYEWLGKQVEEGKVSFQDVKHGMTTMILGCSTYSTRFHRIECFVPSTSPILTDEVREWVLDTLSKGLATSSLCGYFHGSDGLKTIVTARRYADFAWLTSTAVPLIENHLNIPAFALDFLQGLFLLTKAKVFPVQEGVQLFKRLAKDVISKLDFKTVYGDRPEEKNMQPKDRKHISGHLGPDAEYDCSLDINPDTLANFFSYLIKMSSPPRDDLVMPLALKLVGHAPHMKWNDFHPLWIPFLKELIPVLESHNIPLTTPRYQQIFGAILEAYAAAYVGTKPAQGVSSDRTVPNCHCQDCLVLNRFLQDPNQRQCRFPVSKRRRHHLHQQIDSWQIECSHASDRSGVQDTLVVRKLRPNPEAIWNARREEAGEQMQEFDQMKLGLLLGNDYPRIMQLLWDRPVNLAPGRGGVTYMPAPVQAHSAAPANPPPQARPAGLSHIPPPPMQQPVSTYGLGPNRHPGQAPPGHPMGPTGWFDFPNDKPFPTAPPGRFGVYPPKNAVPPPTIHMPPGVPEPRLPGGGGPALSSMPTMPNQMPGQGPMFGGRPGHFSAPPPGGPLAQIGGNAGGPPQGTLPNISSAGLPQPVAGTKRKAEHEVIDLT